MLFVSSLFFNPRNFIELWWSLRSHLTTCSRPSSLRDVSTMETRSSRRILNRIQASNLDPWLRHLCRKSWVSIDIRYDCRPLMISLLSIPKLPSSNLMTPMVHARWTSRMPLHPSPSRLRRWEILFVVKPKVRVEPQAPCLRSNSPTPFWCLCHWRLRIATILIKVCQENLTLLCLTQISNGPQPNWACNQTNLIHFFRVGLRQFSSSNPIYFVSYETLNPINQDLFCTFSFLAHYLDLELC